MAKEESIRMTGVVHEVLLNAMFRVLLLNSHKVIATLGGRMRQHNIQILLGDSVDIEMSPYDMNRGRVVFRNKS